MKQTAQRVFLETLAAIQIPAVLARKLGRAGSVIHAGGASIDLRDFREIVAIAFGKASLPMAEALSEILAPEFQVDGILVGPASPPGAAAGRAILDRLAQCDERSLIFFLISGGGSALVEQPLDGNITLEDFQKLHLALVTCGAPIEEINVIRKRLSATKGGRLATAAPRAMKITLAISDVPEGEESALASGPRSRTLRRTRTLNKSRVSTIYFRSCRCLFAACSNDTRFRKLLNSAILLSRGPVLNCCCANTI